MRTTLRFLSRLAVAALVLPGAALFAQKKPKENAEVLVSIKHAEYDVPTSATYGFVFKETGAGSSLVSTSGSGSGSGVYTSPAASSVLLKPGHLYEATLSSSDWDYGELKVSAPPGYAVYIDDRPTGTARVTSSPGTVSRIEIRPMDDSSMLPAGMALSPQVGDVIWSISAGRYANGRSAGAIEWRSSTFTSALLSPLSLDYVEPVSSEIYVHHHSDGALMELWTPQMHLYVRRGATGAGYTIEIYHPDAVVTSDHGDATNGPFDFSQAPFLEYHITNPNGTTWNDQISIEKVARNATGSTKSTTWAMSKSGSNWSVVETDSLKITELNSSTTSGVRTETIVVRDNAGTPNVATKDIRKYETFGWGQEEMTQEIADPDGLALTTNFTYGTTSSASGYGRLASVTGPDGSWEAYVYDGTTAGWGNLSAVYRPWQDGPTGGAAAATATNCAATFFDYAAERAPFLDLPAGSHVKIANVDVAQTAVSYAFPGNAPNGEPLRTETVNTYTASGTSLATTRKVYHRTASPDFAGRMYSQQSPDGTKVAALRYKGVWSTSTLWGEYHFSGFSSAVTDGTTTALAVNSFDSRSFDTVYMVPNRSTIDLDVYDSEDNVQYHETYVFTGASGGVPAFELLNRHYFTYLFGKLHFHTDLYGLREINWMTDGAPSGKHFNDGTYEQYQTDSDGRYTGTIKWYQPSDTGYAAQGHLYTNWTRDAANRILTEQISSEDGLTNPSDAVTTAYVYNKAGFVTSQTAESGAGNFTTTTAYANGGRTITQTIPGGFTIITDRYLDGSLKSITGTGVVPEYHSATVNSGGTITQEIHVATSTDVRWKKATTDWAGRTIAEESPAYSSGTFTRQYFYNSVGQPIKTTEPGLADALTEYNAWQQPYRQGLNVDATGGLSTTSGGTDRVTEGDTVFEKIGSNWWLKSTTKAYNASGTAITTGTTKQRITGYSYGNNSGANIASEAVSTDVFGNTTTTTVDIHRGSGSGPTGDWDVRLVTTTVDFPDSTTDQVAITRNGLLQKTVSKEGLVSRYYYDVRRRLISQTDPRIDGTGYLSSPPVRLAYVTHSDRISWQKDTAGNQTSFAYESATARLASITNPLGKVAYQAYNDRGQVLRSWGETTYPVEYAFNSYGEQTTMSTFRGGTGWTGSTWSSSPGAADTTTWAREAATGLLTRKTDAAAGHVDYTYTARGQLATRTWARGVSATYSYDSATGEQTGISYSDSTPALTYTYNRLGQMATVVDGTATATDPRTFAYSATTTMLNSETFPSYFESRVLTRKYDSTTTGALGRNTGFTLSGASGSGTDSDISYGYDAYARFSGLSTPSSGPAFTYSFASNSNLVGSISESLGWTETNSYETDRNLLTQIKGQFSTGVKAQFDYTHDVLNRRQTVTDSGEIFARYNSSAITTHYGYNDRSEVTSAQSYYGSSTTDTSSPVAARGFAYAFDNIGSRTSSAVIGNGSGDTHTTTYTNNNLNQVTGRAGPGSFEVTGFAPTASTVTVGGAATTRQGEYYYKNVTGSGSTFASAAVASTLGGAEARSCFLPPSSETHTYDDDGNLTADGRWNYTWDAENRLVSMETISSLFSVVPRQFIQFKYDYLGRRVRKTVANWNSSSSTYVAVLDRKFIYNGWNLIGEYDVGTSSLSLVTSYIWGLDLSGNLVDGGGVGGLLAIKQVSGSTWHLPYYDANGNLHALVNRGSGTVTAAYEYSPFGETLRANGSYAASNPFRFSTKYADTETGLLYYGYRYYNPSLGRWLGRDPLEEKGGLHLYAFCHNNAVNSWDVLGRDDNGDYEPADDATMLQIHPGWQKIDGLTWYDPVQFETYHWPGYHESTDNSVEDITQSESWANMLQASDEAGLAAWRESTWGATNAFLSDKAIGDGVFLSKVIGSVVDAVSNTINAIESALTPLKGTNIEIGALQTLGPVSESSFSSGSAPPSAPASAPVPVTPNVGDTTVSGENIAGKTSEAPNSATTGWPTATAEGFIKDKYIVGGSFGPFMGDNRSFTTSPAGITNSRYTITASEGDVSALQNKTHFPFGIGGWAGTPTSWGSETKVVDGVYHINMGIQAQDPYGFGLAPKVGGSVDLIVHVYPDGVGVHGFVTSTPYPSFQVFVNGTSVFQHDQQAIGTAFIPIGSNTSSKVDVWIPNQPKVEKK